jgi:hypothetical protein
VSEFSFDRQFPLDRRFDQVEASPVGRVVTSLFATLPLQATGIQLDDSLSRTIMTLGFRPEMFAVVSRRLDCLNCIRDRGSFVDDPLLQLIDTSGLDPLSCHLPQPQESFG